MDIKFKFKELKDSDMYSEISLGDIERATGISKSTLSNFYNRSDQVRAVNLAYLIKLRDFFKLDSIDELIEVVPEPATFEFIGHVTNESNSMQLVLLKKTSNDIETYAVLRLTDALYIDREIFKFESVDGGVLNNTELQNKMLNDNEFPNDINEFSDLHHKLLNQEIEKNTLRHLVKEMPSNLKFRKSVLSNFKQLTSGINFLSGISNEEMKSLATVLMEQYKVGNLLDKNVKLFVELPERAERVTNIHLKQDTSNYSLKPVQIERNVKPYYVEPTYTTPKWTE